MRIYVNREDARLGYSSPNYCPAARALRRKTKQPGVNVSPLFTSLLDHDGSETTLANSEKLTSAIKEFDRGECFPAGYYYLWEVHRKSPLREQK